MHGGCAFADSAQAGKWIKTDRRDSEKLAVLHRAGDLTAVWVPDPTHEVLRDLVRARVDASMQLMRARQQLLAFLLRHGRRLCHRQALDAAPPCLAGWQTFAEEVHQAVFQGLSGGRVGRHTEARCADRPHRDDGRSLVAGASGRSAPRPAWHRHDFGG